ncbi:MAG: hypothetical protein AAFM91_14390 [Pseudomonadota bacterium]
MPHSISKGLNLRRALAYGIAIGVSGLWLFGVVLPQLDVTVRQNHGPSPSPIYSTPPTAQRVQDFLDALTSVSRTDRYEALSTAELQALAYADAFARLALAARWLDDNPDIARQLVIDAAIDLNDPQPLRWLVREAYSQTADDGRDIARLFHRYRLEALADNLGEPTGMLPQLARALRARGLNDADWQSLQQQIAADRRRVDQRRTAKPSG